MEESLKPKSTRELLLSMQSEIHNLAKSIYELSAGLKELEDKRIATMEKRLIDLENFFQQLKGGWKFALIIWAIITACIVGLLKYFTK